MAAKKSSIRISAKNKNDATLVKVLMRHPMESGNRKDKKTGKTIPAHFIQEVTCESGGSTSLTAYLTGGVSANPYISFKFKGNKGDDVKVTWVDNTGASESGSTKIR